MKIFIFSFEVQLTPLFRGCWNECSQSGGPCPWCGRSGLCCSKRTSGNPECMSGMIGGSDVHRCTLPDWIIQGKLIILLENNLPVHNPTNNIIPICDFKFLYCHISDKYHIVDQSVSIEGCVGQIFVGEMYKEADKSLDADWCAFKVQTNPECGNSFFYNDDANDNYNKTTCYCEKDGVSCQRTQNLDFKEYMLGCKYNNKLFRNVNRILKCK